MELTVENAILQGYTKFGIEGREWQDVQDLHDGVFEEVEEEDWDDICLFEKESSQPRISSQTIGTLLSDYIGDSDSEESGRDSDCVYDTIMQMDFSLIANEINKKLSAHKYWMLTDIKLITKNND